MCTVIGQRCKTRGTRSRFDANRRRCIAGMLPRRVSGLVQRKAVHSRDSLLSVYVILARGNGVAGETSPYCCGHSASDNGGQRLLQRDHGGIQSVETTSVDRVVNKYGALCYFMMPCVRLASLIVARDVLPYCNSHTRRVRYESKIDLVHGRSICNEACVDNRGIICDVGVADDVSCDIVANDFVGTRGDIDYYHQPSRSLPLVVE